MILAPYCGDLGLPPGSPALFATASSESTLRTTDGEGPTVTGCEPT